jgi:hypothetical protein
MDGAGSGSCSVVGFVIGGVETTASSAAVSVSVSYREKLNARYLPSRYFLQFTLCHVGPFCG